jgi:hypothetical protein
MAAELTEAEFSRNLNSKFFVETEANGKVELELVEVKGYPKAEQEHPGMERFSIYFAGPSGVYLPQHSYRLSHDRMGEFEVFIVPVGKSDETFNYEAVFNYFKDSAQQGSE